jgi:hypothetical protein
LQQDAFLMPGCCGQRRRLAGRGRRGRCRRNGQKGGDDNAQR